MIPHNEDRLSFSSFVHDQEHIAPNPDPNSKPASTNTSQRKRNLPGNPDPDAEVIALSPKSLMATNRFFCEICNKGFQREQNLQLHKRGHNLPWKLKQRTNKDQVKKKVYICPEKSCVHHDPARALGDLTGIKKHFSRKHGEKKWKCDKCSKKYAVISDWKAHSKICGSRDYRCDCGTLFSRKDSFITHRAFCVALAEASANFVSIPSPLVENSTVPNHTTLLGQTNINSDQIPLQANAYGLSSPQSPHVTSDSVHNQSKLQGEGSNRWQVNEYMNNKNIPQRELPKTQDDEIKKGNYNGLNNQDGHMTSLSATTLLQKAVQMGSSSDSNISTMFELMTSSISNNTMLNSNRFKPKNNEQELNKDFLGVEYF